MQNVQIFTFLLACEFVLQENSPGRYSCKRNWREYGDSLFPTAKSLCIENKIFYHVVLLVKGFGILLPLLAAHSRKSLTQNKNEFSLVSDSPRTVYHAICSYPRWLTLLLLEFPTLDARMLSCQANSCWAAVACRWRYHLDYHVIVTSKLWQLSSCYMSSWTFLNKGQEPQRGVWGRQVDMGSTVFISW